MPPKAAKAAKKKGLKGEKKAVRQMIRSDLHKAGYLESRNARARTRLDAGTVAAGAYVAGLLKPFTHGSGCRMPSDGMYPTSVVSSFNRFSNLVISAGSGYVAGIVVSPDIKNQYRQITAATGVSGNYTWGLSQPGGAYSSMAANAAFFRGAVNLGVRFTFQGPMLTRGGRLVATLLPPGGADAVGGLPVTDAAVFASPRTVIFDIARVESPTLEFFWVPSSGEAPVLFSSGNLQRSASTWTSVTSTDVVLGDPSWCFIFQTAYGAAAAPNDVKFDCTVEITNNTEFISGFGGSQQLFPGKIVPGSDADVAEILKPVEASMSNSVISQAANGQADIGKLVTDTMSSLGAVAGQLAPYADMAKTIWSSLNPAMAGKAGATQGEFSLGSLEAFAEETPFLLARHRAAVALELPELSPFVDYTHPSQLRRRQPSSSEGQSAWLMRLISALQERLSETRSEAGDPSQWTRVLPPPLARAGR